MALHSSTINQREESPFVGAAHPTLDSLWALC